MYIRVQLELSGLHSQRTSSCNDAVYVFLTVSPALLLDLIVNMPVYILSKNYDSFCAYRGLDYLQPPRAQHWSWGHL